MHQELLDFMKKTGKYADVICLQEVLDNPKGIMNTGLEGSVEDIFSQIALALPNFNGYSAIPQKNERGLATFVKKDWEVLATDDQFVLGARDTMVDGKWSTIGINMQYAKIRKGETFHIWNLHGKFVGMEKLDTPESLEQSRNISRIIKPVEGKRILCGDFNLNPDTESIRMLEEIPLRNLVKEYGVKSTRPSFFQFPEKHADYIMPSNEIEIKDFRVMDDEVSDHLPLYLDCS